MSARASVLNEARREVAVPALSAHGLSSMAVALSGIY